MLRAELLGVPALVVCVGLAVACTSPEQAAPEGTQVVVQGLTNEDLLYTATIADVDGSMEEAVAVSSDVTGIDLSNPDTEGIAKPQGAENGLFVAWIGLPCEDRPSLELVLDDDRLVVRLDRGPQREGETCPHYPHYFALRLEFDRPIDADSTEFEVVK